MSHRPHEPPWRAAPRRPAPRSRAEWRAGVTAGAAQRACCRCERINVKLAASWWPFQGVSPSRYRHAAPRSSTGKLRGSDWPLLLIFGLTRSEGARACEPRRPPLPWGSRTLPQASAASLQRRRHFPPLQGAGFLSHRHARACPGHPRLTYGEAKTWMAGTSSAKTRFALLPGHDEREAVGRATATCSFHRSASSQALPVQCRRCS